MDLITPFLDKNTLPPPSLEKRVHDALLKQDFAQAEQWIQEHLAAHPQDPQFLYFLGVSHAFQGRIAQALTALKKATQLDPSHTHAAICLSVLMNDIGQYEAAQTVFEQANQSVLHKKKGEDVEIDKKFAVKHLELADLYFRYRRYEEAIEDYTQAIRLDPSLLEVRIRRAKAYAKKGSVSRALQELQQLKQEHPDSVPVRLQLSLLYYSQENFLDAELELEQLLQIHPENEEAKTYLNLLQKKRLEPFS